MYRSHFNPVFSFFYPRYHDLSFRFWRVIAGLILMAGVLPARPAYAVPAVVTYYVSASGGSDSNTGADPGHPLRTIARVNGLSLNAGDQVLFKCGDTWRAEMLKVTRSGQSGSPITYSSYPAGCIDQPRLDGSQPVTGWSVYAGNIYVADLGVGANLALFRSGNTNYDINQLFRGGVRLTMGRWPNLDAGDGGYSTVDAQPAGDQLVDYQLPSGNWTGATIHLKVIRWSMVNRTVTAQSGTQLTLNLAPGCWKNSCAGWGYFINNSLAALDQDGEWYYDASAHKVYLVASSNPNSATIEASLVLCDTARNFGAVNLGTDMHAAVSYVVVDNLDLRGWFQHGIASPTNLNPEENSAITLKNNTIRDVDDSGINLWSWVYSASDGLDGWRGGNQILIQANLIDGANHFGIHTPSRETIITYNTIRNIAVIAHLNQSGMGCGMQGSEGSCTEDGAGLRIYVDKPDRSGYGFTVSYNRFENIGGNGVQTFGSSSIFSYNVFTYTCISKGDCGAIGAFGSGDLSVSHVHDLQILNNLILYTIGNTDGTRSDFRALFGFGIYLDNGSRNVTTQGNTIAYATVSGILYQNSTGAVIDNTIFQNVTGALWADQVRITASPSALTAFTGNTLVSANNHSRNLGLVSAGQVGTASLNRYYHAANTAMQIDLNGQSRSLAQWQSDSGKDMNSVTASTAFAAKLMLFYNDTPVDKVSSFPGLEFSDLDGNAIGKSFTLPPYASRVVEIAKDTRPKMYLPLMVK
jgi:parallel beta-helix repeat protein